MSEIRATTISDLAGTGPATLTGQSAAKVWATIDSDPIGFFQSFNTSSATDNGTGNYTVNFASAFAYSRYAAVAGMYSTDGASANITNEATSSLIFRGASNSGAALDGDGHLIIHGDLA